MDLAYSPHQPHTSVLPVVRNGMSPPRTLELLYDIFVIGDAAFKIQ